VENQVTLDRQKLKELFGDHDAYLVGPAARYVLSGGTQPLRWDVVADLEGVTDRLRQCCKYPILDTNTGISIPSLSLYVHLADVSHYLRTVPVGKDAVALHLGSGAVLFAAEYWNNPHQEITTRPTRKWW